MEHFKDFSPLIKRDRTVNFFTNYSFFMATFSLIVAIFAVLAYAVLQEIEVQSIIPALVFCASVVLILLGFILNVVSNHLKVTVGSTALASIRELKGRGIEYLGYSFVQKQEPLIIVHTKEEDFCLSLHKSLDTDNDIRILQIIETKIPLHIACIRKLIEIFDEREIVEENRAQEEREKSARIKISSYWE